MSSIGVFVGLRCVYLHCSLHPSSWRFPVSEGMFFPVNELYGFQLLRTNSVDIMYCKGTSQVSHKAGGQQSQELGCNTFYIVLISSDGLLHVMLWILIIKLALDVDPNNRMCLTYRRRKKNWTIWIICASGSSY